MKKTKSLTVSDLLATLPKSARIMGFKIHRKSGVKNTSITFVNNGQIVSAHFEERRLS